MCSLQYTILDETCRASDEVLTAVATRNLMNSVSQLKQFGAGYGKLFFVHIRSVYCNKRWCDL